MAREEIATMRERDEWDSGYDKGEAKGTGEGRA
jgi:hypothetical protein